MRPGIVIFDMDDVLCHYDLGRRLRALSRISGKMPRDIRAAIWDSGFEGESDAGGYPDEAEYLAEFGKRLGHPITREEWIAARKESMTPFPDVLSLARRIGEQARIAIYTNNGPILKTALPQLFPEAAALFPDVYCSFEFATKKPDPASFAQLMRVMKADARDCWFIDDKRSNVQGARMAGLRGHHYRSYRLLLQEARDLGFQA
ncbi:HAD family hydrolase [Aestuariivirga sp.]|uniref:HAD family hydrolase n=1 Tax=Aestuariivirga sp. TaxID=2650926 RepID=UPI0039E249AA